MDYKLYVKKLYEDAKLPTKANPTDSGFDVYVYSFKKLYTHSGSDSERIFDKPEQIENRIENTSENRKGLKLQYLERVLIDTGLVVTVGNGYEIQLRPRSGNALNKGLSIVNTPGTIDESYRGTLGVIIVNLSRASQFIQVGDKIAQIVPCPILLPELVVVDELPTTDRGAAGFGSTGSR